MSRLAFQVTRLYSHCCLPWKPLIHLKSMLITEDIICWWQSMMKKILSHLIYAVSFLGTLLHVLHSAFLACQTCNHYKATTQMESSNGFSSCLKDKYIKHDHAYADYPQAFWSWMEMWAGIHRRTRVLPDSRQLLHATMNSLHQWTPLSILHIFFQNISLLS